MSDAVSVRDLFLGCFISICTIISYDLYVSLYDIPHSIFRSR